MILAEGSLEILDFLGSHEIGFFKDLRKIINPRTKKPFGATTISARLKELEKAKALERIAAQTNLRRNTVGYRITSEGRKAFQLSVEFEKNLSKFLKSE
jgi:DNA-binding HxlR family transcriptional regulator